MPFWLNQALGGAAEGATDWMNRRAASRDDALRRAENWSHQIQLQSLNDPNASAEEIAAALGPDAPPELIAAIRARKTREQGAQEAAVRRQEAKDAEAERKAQVTEQRLQGAENRQGAQFMETQGRLSTEARQNRETHAGERADTAAQHRADQAFQAEQNRLGREATRTNAEAGRTSTQAAAAQAHADAQEASIESQVRAIRQQAQNEVSLGHQVDFEAINRLTELLKEQLPSRKGVKPAAGAAPSAPQAGPPAGTRRIISGRPAMWDGHGWVAQ